MLAFSVLTLYALYHTALDDFGKPYAFQLSEFTINYQGGFVRRGLFGELLLQFCTFTRCPPLPIIFTLCWGSFIFVILFLLYVFYKHGLCWWIIPTSYMLGSSYICIIRKDYLIISLFILAFHLYRRAHWPATVRLLTFSVITTIGILIHEGMSFMFIPILALIAFCDHGISASKWVRLTAFLMPLLAMVACSIYTGDAATAQAIHSSWLPWAGEIVDTNTLSASLNALTWSISDALNVNQSILLAAHDHQPASTIIYRIIAWGIILYMGTRYVSAMSLHRSPNLNDDNARAACLFLLLFICMLPLWLGLSCDFGRLSMQLFAITFISYHYIPTASVPQRAVMAMRRINTSIGRILPATPIITTLLLFTSISPCYFTIEWLWDWSVTNSLLEYFHKKWFLFHLQ